jgi:formylglycine-generating enzyme required for sulfatase activity
MVLVATGNGDFCIDAREVTQSDYAAFLAKVPSLSGQPPVCGFNSTYQPENNAGGAAACGPSSYDPTIKGDRPVVCVDWCDALAYCGSLGKRLCGDIATGGPISWDQSSKWAQDEWYRACSGDGFTSYPYGDIYEKFTCNGKDQGVNTTVPVGDLPGCEGGFPGLFHMSGNAIEWSDACKPNTDPSKEDLCLIRGGSFFDSSIGLQCSKTFSLPRDGVASDVGFRCCGG